jgi:hypothetical protein
MLFVTLDCGRKVSLDALDYSRTYACLLEGRPDPDLNARIIEHATTERDATWGKRPFYVIPPVLDLRDPAHPVMPPAQFRAWLTCYEPINPEFMGSHLVVLWFSDECHSEPLAEVVFRAIRGLPWEQLAQDFDW